MESPLNVFYHYTSIGSAIGITTSKNMWATSIHYLNDGAEFEYGFDLLRKELNKTDSGRHFAQAIARSEAADSVELNRKRVDPFVVSFSTAADLLSQWRAYCPPGRGIAFGFAGEDVTHAAEEGGFELVQCVYDEDEHQRLVQDLVTDWRDRFECAEAGQKQGLATDFMTAFSILSARLKDTSFREESEWRLVSVAGRALSPKYREGVSTVIPYVELPLPSTLMLPHVIVGPTPHQRLARRAISHMCSTSGWICRRLQPSKTPFRSW